MAVDHIEAGADTEALQGAAEAAAQAGFSGEAVEIAQVGAQPGAAAGGTDRQAALEVAAHRHHAGKGVGVGEQGAEIKGGGGLAAGVTQQHRHAGRQLHDPVVDGVGDRAVVAEEAVGDGAQVFLQPLRIGAEGFARAVAAGGHQRHTQLPQQQDMQGAGGQHHPQPGVVRGDVGGDATGVAMPPVQQHDRSSRGGEQRFLLSAQAAVAPHPCQIGRQQGEGLLGPALAPPQLGHRRLQAGQAEQLEAPHPLQRHDPPGPQGCARRGQAGAGEAAGPRWITAAGAAGGGPAQPRTTGGAAGGLGVEAAVGGIGVFSGAGGTEGKGGQRGVAPLERQGSEDAEAGPAVGAAGEGVATAAAGGIAELRQAGGAGGQIGQHQGGSAGGGGVSSGGGGGIGSGCADMEAAGVAVGMGSQPLRLQTIEATVGRALAGQALQEGRERGRRALQLQADAGGGVLDPAGQLQSRGQPVHEGTEAHPLHQPLDVEPQTPAPGGTHAGVGAGWGSGWGWRW